MKNKAYKITVAVIVILFVLCFGFEIWNFIEIAVKYDSVGGSVSKVESYYSDETTHITVYADYTYKGQEYKEVRIAAVNMVNKGDKVKLYINPNNPNEVTTIGYNIFPIVAATIFIIVILGMCKLFKSFEANASEALTEENGVILNCIVEEIKEIQGKRAKAYYFLCSYELEDVKYIFTSGTFYSSIYDAYPIGSSIKVLVDKDNYKINRIYYGKKEVV